MLLNFVEPALFVRVKHEELVRNRFILIILHRLELCTLPGIVAAHRVDATVAEENVRVGLAADDLQDQ